MAISLKVESLMSTALVTVRDTDLIKVAQAEMKLGSMRHIPVVDAKDNLVGMLSARDVLAAMAKGKKEVRVGELMSTPPISVRPETSVRKAIDLLLEHKFGALPVLGSDGQVIGIVTETDFLRASRDAFRQVGPPKHGVLAAPGR